MSFFGSLFGAEQAYQRWRDLITESVARAEAMLEENPNDEKALKILEAADHSMACAMAFNFGRSRP